MLGTVLVGTLILTVILGLPQFLVKGDIKYALKWLLIGAIFNFVFLWVYVYFALPAMTGPLGGYGFLWLPMLINVCAAGAMTMFKSEDYRSDEDDSRNHVAAFLIMGGALLVLVIIWVVISFSSWKQDSRKLAFSNVVPAAPVIEIMGDGTTKVRDASIPGSDEKHLPIVTDGNALNRAGGSLTGTLGSNYSWGKQVVQSINGHLYRVSLMEFKDFWAWRRNSTKTTPQFIMIDAENPLVESAPTPYTIKYFTGAYFGNDVLRYLYTHGYSSYLLLDPTIEVSDDLKVYETVGLGKYVMGWSGIEIQAMAMVDVTTGAVDVCQISNCPAWIDRVLPDDATDTYVDWYGLYNDAGWWNLGKVNTLMGADDKAVPIYNGEHVAWQYIMTSRNMKDNSGVGLILYDARERVGTYYTFNSPFPVGGQVRSTFENNKTLKQSSTTVDQMILVNIFGENTWVATMVTPAANGTQYQYTAFARANKTTVSDDVQFDKDPKIALRNYEMWLATHRDTSEADPTQESVTVILEGYVASVGTTTVQGNTYHVFTMNDMDAKPVTYTDDNGAEQTRYFVGLYSPTQTIELPLTASGHHVLVTYLDTNLSAEVQIQAFEDLDVPPQ